MGHPDPLLLLKLGGGTSPRPSISVLRVVMAVAMHCAVCTICSAGGFTLFLLLDGIHADTNNYDYQNQRYEYRANIR